MSDTDWLTKLKPGDKVLVGSVGWGVSHEEGRVIKPGKLHVQIGSGHDFQYVRKFSIKSGWRVGDGLREFLKPYDAGILAAEKEEQDRIVLACRLSRVGWRDLDHETLKAVAKLLPENKERP